MRDELTPREVAQELGVTVRTVQRWIATGRLPGSRVGGRMRVPRSAIQAAPSPGRRAPSPRPIRALLIANRGEIAARIARTARGLGMRVIRVHEPDEPAPSGGDLVLPIRAYLDADAVLAAARAAGADAIHPGYGFLAENAAFAEGGQRRRAGLGRPAAGGHRALGDKAAPDAWPPPRRADRARLDGPTRVMPRSPRPRGRSGSRSW